MKANFLFPGKFRTGGWILFIPGLILGVLFLFFNFEPTFLEINMPALLSESFMDGAVFCTYTETNLIDEIAGVLIIMGGLLIAFSKEKQEDEFISRIRLESLVWATYVNYAVLLLAIIFVYELAFLWIMVINMFTLLFFFIIRFNWVLYQSRKRMPHEE